MRAFSSKLETYFRPSTVEVIAQSDQKPESQEALFHILQFLC